MTYNPKSECGLIMLALIMLPAFGRAQEPVFIDEFAKDVLTNVQSEYVICAAYFSTYLQSPDIDQETTEEVRSYWFGALARATSLLEQAGQTGEAAQQAVLTQFEAEFNNMKRRIEGGLTNLAMLNRNHRERCYAVMADSGLDRLIAEQFFLRLSD